jgi:hypothetical protein
MKAGEEVAYRPYAERRREFRQQLDQLAEFVRNEGIGDLEPTTWSVTYINHIEYEGFHNVGPAKCESDASGTVERPEANTASGFDSAGATQVQGRRKCLGWN